MTCVLGPRRDARDECMCLCSSSLLGRSMLRRLRAADVLTKLQLQAERRALQPTLGAARLGESPRRARLAASSQLA